MIPKIESNATGLSKKNRNKNKRRQVVLYLLFGNLVLSASFKIEFEEDLYIPLITLTR